MKGYMYILECSDGTYYTGSTVDLERRVAEHSGHLDTLPVVSIRGFAATRQPSECQPLAECSEQSEVRIEASEDRGANYTKNRRPVKLVYYEEYSRIDEAFYREKQVQKWSHAKKKALIENRSHDLPLLAKKEFSKRLSR